MIMEIDMKANLKWGLPMEMEFIFIMMDQNMMENHVNDLKDGKGIYINKDGEIYEGEYKDGKMDRKRKNNLLR